MSGAICGLIHIDNKPVCVSRGLSMIDKLDNCKLDITKTVTTYNVFMGCGLLYVTPESKQEILPFHDVEKGLIITADAIIDNRKELIDSLGLASNEAQIITDSQLILGAYEKWQGDCPKYLIGDYAFVIWDENEEKVFAARDHVGGRTLYYKFKDNTFSFSTLIKPIKENEPLNERWITDLLALPTVLHISECEESIYEHIYELPPAHSLTIVKNTISQRRYWNPLKEVKPLKLKSDMEYDEEFKKVFYEAVRCRLRTENEVSIMLSGGLDSGSVACIAASMLNEDGKKLKTYTSIPMKAFKNNTSADRVANESEYVESFAEKYKNIDLYFCRCEGKDSLTDMSKYTDILEQPYKNFQNRYWVNEIMDKVSSSGGKVLLTGQFGNFTISYGNFPTHIKTLFQKGRFLEIIKEIKGCSKLEGLTSGFIIKRLISLLVFDNLKNKRLKNKSQKFNSPINLNLIKKWDVEKRFKRDGFCENSQQYTNIHETRKFIVDSVLFSQIGTIETKLPLEKGIVFRDPTKDKRVIEFCLSLPSNQFVRDGEQRYLIRRAMKGILPNKILSCSKRGLQGADWIQRLEPKRDYIEDKLKELLQNEAYQKYLDFDKLKEQMKYLENERINSKLIDIRLILMSLSLYSFMEGGEKNVK
jgi:asparagine synthase (glutamine-hydrolysing)